MQPKDLKIMQQVFGKDNVLVLDGSPESAAALDKLGMGKANEGSSPKDLAMGAVFDFIGFMCVVCGAPEEAMLGAVEAFWMHYDMMPERPAIQTWAEKVKAAEGGEPKP